MSFNLVYVLCVCVWSVALWCPTLLNPMDCSPVGSSVHGISQPRIQEWAAICSSRAFSWPRDRTSGSCSAGGFFTAEPPGKPGFNTVHTRYIPAARLLRYVNNMILFYFLCFFILCIVKVSIRTSTDVLQWFILHEKTTTTKLGKK